MRRTAPAVKMMSELEFEKLITTPYHRRLTAFVQSQMRSDPRNSQADIDEVVQLVLVYLWERFSKRLPTDQPHLWAYICEKARSQIKDYAAYRLTHTRNTHSLHETIEDGEEPANDEPERDYYAEQVLQKCLLDLSVAHRTVLIEYYIEGWTQEEMAEARGLKRNTVCELIQRATLALRKRWYGRTGLPVVNGDKSLSILGRVWGGVV